MSARALAAAPGQVTVQVHTGDGGEWDAAVGALPDATAAHRYAWKSLIEDVYQQECLYLSARRGDRITGLLPLVDVRSLFFGRVLVSMPYLNAGGPIGGDAEVASLAQHAVQLASTRRVRRLEFRALRELPIGLPASMEKIGCVLDLPGSSDDLWKSLGSKLRSQVRRPQKAGVEMHFGADQVDAFFRVFSRNMRDLGSPSHASRFFAAIAQRFGNQAWFGCAYLRGEPIAAGCGLQFGDEVEMTWASTVREYNPLSPNMLLYWAYMERAGNIGLKRFNFGRSTPGSGAHRFKRQWGARDVPLFWHRWPDVPHAAPTPERGALSLASRLWQRLPVPLATAVGARVRGGIPA